jgi:hypothetical protein
MMRRFTISIVALCGCEWGGGPGPGPTGLIDGASPSDSFIRADAAGKDASADAAADAAVDGAPATTGHLLLSEIAVAPTGAELVEIYNPLSQPVDLTHYFIANHGSYFKLPTAAPALPSGHFIVQFAAGSTIDAGAVITIATGTAAAFSSAYGMPPTYSIADATVIKTDVAGTPSLTDSGALVVLFEWDGTNALVSDVDIMIVGKPSATNALVNKSGVSQGGSTYATDANTIAAQPSTPAAGTSTKRVAAESGHETQAGTGNGLTGHDETSEDTAATWDRTFSAPTPGQIAATL